MGKFFNLLGSDQSLFMDENVFNPNYVPGDYIHRNPQMQAIAMCIKPALAGGRAINAQIFGPPATGKTTAMRKLEEELTEIPGGERLVFVHINCQIHTSKFSIFSQVHRKIFGHAPAETGVPFKKVYEAIFNKLQKEKKCLIVALDDMNYLFYERFANEVLYDILRAYEVYPQARTTIFSIVSDTDFSYKIDDKVRSMFRPEEIYFPPYSALEMYNILADRARIGLVRDVMRDELIQIISDFAYENGDIRLGIETMKKCIALAEMDGLTSVKPEHVEKAMTNPRAAALEQLMASLGERETDLLKKLVGWKGEGDVESGMLYEKFNEKAKVSYTTFYRILDKLENIKIIDTKFTGRGKKGQSRKIILRYSRKDLKLAMGKSD